MNDLHFAEIEIQTQPVNNAGSLKITPNSDMAVPIAPRAPDPIRERFFEMRKLSSMRPFPRNDSELFYRQAKFMEDFEDDYAGDAAFNMYFPFYQRMGYDYLRTYFTWRTRVRCGEIFDTSLSYIFLYIYELLSNVGVSGPDEGLCKLMDLWRAFSHIHPAIEINLPKWLKDYHIYYETPQNFGDFIREQNLERHYVLTLMSDVCTADRLGAWNSISKYDVTKSRFYKDGNEELLSRCFDAVIIDIEEFCKTKGASFEDMLVYSVSTRRPWKPFGNALFGNFIKQSDREVHISKYEHYYLKNGEWTAKLPVYYSSQKEFVGYLIKKTESCLRAATGYKYKLAAEMKPGTKSFRELQKPAAKRAELDRIINRAVENFCNEQKRVVVAVDHKSLERIREEALETQESLIVEETYHPPNASPNTPFKDSPPEPPATLSFADGWKELAKNLTAIEKEALSVILNGGEIKTFANEKNIMPEVLIDGINEKASDCIGDSIMELTDDVYIFDVYRENIEGMCRIVTS